MFKKFIFIIVFMLFFFGVNPVQSNGMNFSVPQEIMVYAFNGSLILNVSFFSKKAFLNSQIVTSNYEIYIIISYYFSQEKCTQITI